jgi:flagellar biosynthesis/type III secretory pathway M-ring protein FliF/YscJ
MAPGTQLEKAAPPVPLPAGFAGRLAALWQLGRVRWATLAPSQRRWSLVAAVLMASVLGGLAWYGLRTDWRTLYAGLDPADAREIGQTLTQAQIDFEPTADGTGNVRASVTLDYDPTASDETEEAYDPDQTVLLSMQRTEQSAGAQPVAAGVPGTASNAPNSSASGGLPVYPQQSTPPQSAKTESGTYAASKTTRHVIENPGRVRRMTAAIVVNDRFVPAAGKGKPAVWQPRTADELNHLSALAEASVGFDKARGDMVTVQDLAFDANHAAQPASIPGQVISVAENSPCWSSILRCWPACWPCWPLGCGRRSRGRARRRRKSPRNCPRAPQRRTLCARRSLPKGKPNARATRRSSSR